MTDCIILAGGLGTRLQEVVKDRPKPLALINGTPFLELLLVQLKTQGLTKIVLAVSYKASQIMQKYPHLCFSIEQEPLGTGGAIKQAIKYTSSKNVLVLNGDSYLDFSFKTLKQAHAVNDADITLAYTTVQNDARYGALKIETKTGKILSFQEKKKGSFINGGIYFLKRDLFDDLPLGLRFSLETEAFPLLLKKRCFGYYCPNLFLDIGTPSSYDQAQKVLKHLTGTTPCNPF